MMAGGMKTQVKHGSSKTIKLRIVATHNTTELEVDMDWNDKLKVRVAVHYLSSCFDNTGMLPGKLMLSARMEVDSRPYVCMDRRS